MVLRLVYISNWVEYQLVNIYVVLKSGCVVGYGVVCLFDVGYKMYLLYVDDLKIVKVLFCRFVLYIFVGYDLIFIQFIDND